MGKKKRYRGHYCKVCGEVKANEKFSGKGHKKHICKKCSKLSNEDKEIKIILNDIFKLYRFGNLSKNNKNFLEKYQNDEREKVKNAVKEVQEHFSGKNYNYEDYYEEDFDECVDASVSLPDDDDFPF